MLYVIQVSPGREKELAGRLEGQGVRALVPRENRLVRSGGSWKQKEYILFGGYVFLDMAYNAENYYKVKKLPGVIRFLGGGSPSRLSYLEAEWIRLLAGKDNTPVEPTLVRIGEGGRLETVDGILQKFENRVTKVDRRSRRATFEITVCGEKKEVQLSIRLEEDQAGAGRKSQEDAGGEPLDGAVQEGAAGKTIKETD